MSVHAEDHYRMSRVLSPEGEKDRILRELVSLSFN